MGNYITDSDLKSVVGGDTLFTQISDLDKDGFADTTVVDQAIERAEARVNGFLRPRFVVPVSNPPQLIKDLTLDIARYYLANNRGIGDLEKYYRAYKDSIAILKDIRSGAMELDIATKPTGSASVTMGGIVDAADHDDGGPFWDETWREEGTSEDDVNDGLP